MRMRGVRMTNMSMAFVIMGVAGAALIMIMRMVMHGSILPLWARLHFRNYRLVGSLTRSKLECIDAPANGCDDETSFWLTRLDAGKSILTGELRAGHDGTNCKIDLLGRARVYAHGGPNNVALWRKHAVPGAGGPGRYAIYPGLRNRIAHARKPLEHSEPGKPFANTHPDNSLSLGPHPAHFIFTVSVRSFWAATACGKCSKLRWLFRTFQSTCRQ